MSACVVWMDSEHAKIFKISAEAPVVAKELSHHDVPPIGSRHDNFKHNAEEHFFHNVALEIGNVEELLVFGAGMAKTHFKTHLEKHHHGQLAKSLIGVETLDKLSDNQILEAARKFMKKYNTYNSSI